MDGGDFELLVQTPAGARAYTDTGLDSQAEYVYLLKEVEGTGSAQAALVREFVPQRKADLTITHEAGSFDLLVQGVGEELLVEGSADLESWAAVWGPGFVPSGESIVVADLDVASGQFFRALNQSYPRVGIIGLSMPFELASEATGRVYNVTDFGASPLVIGNDDAIGIRTALSIAQPGDTVWIPAGTYHIRQTLEVPSGVTLRGAGMDETVLVAEGISIAVRIPPLRHDIRLEDFAIRYEGDQETLQHGVYIGSVRQGNNSYRIVVDSLRIEGFSVHGVSLRDCHHVLVRNCIIRYATNEGGGGHGYGIALNYPSNHNNWIRDNTIGPGIRHGVLIQYEAHNNLVEHNLAVDNSEDAFDLHGEGEHRNELRFNIARGSAREGFGVGNTGSTHSSSGPYNWIHNNLVEDSRGGMEIILESDIVFVDHNTFRNNQFGIRVHNLGGDHLYVRGNRFEGNQIGVSLSQSRWIWLEDNHFENHTEYAIGILPGTDAVTESGNTFSGNHQDRFVVE